MKFGEITSVSGMAFYVSKLSGILGLAYDSISVNHLPTFLDTSKVSDKSFSIFMALNPDESFMTVPGYDEDLMKDRKFSYHPVAEKKYYSVNLTSIKQGERTIGTEGYLAVIDSGTSVIIGPEHLITQVVAGLSVKQDCSDVDSLPSITFTFNNEDFVLDPQDYVVKV